MLEEIQNLFLNKSGSYDRFIQFKSIAIFSLVIMFFLFYFNKNYGFVIILISFALFISNLYIGVNSKGVENFNEITLIKLQTLMSLSKKYIDEKMELLRNSNPQNLPAKDIKRIYSNNSLDALYVDANLINFLHSIKALSDYNSYGYFELLKSTNSILRIKRDIDEFYEMNGYYPDNTSEMLESALELKRKCMNNLHDFIYTIPKINKMYKYLSSSTDRFGILLGRVTDSIHNSYKNNIKQKGLNANTNFVTYNTTKPFDYVDNNSIIPGKMDVKLKRFYY